MRVLQRNSLILLLLFSSVSFYAQIANYIANGSFEELYECTFPYGINKVKQWHSNDSSNSYSGLFYSICNGKAPLNGNTYQFARTANTYIISTIYDTNPNGGGRGYLKNRLRQNLQAGKTYCVKFYTNICNTSTYGMDGFGIYFGGNSLDTITKFTIPLTYLNPQVKNPPGNIISDTLNWIPITGTFVANGTEKYALVGNFISNAALTTTLINPTYSPLVFTDVLFDDVSCIELDLPAFAGNDTICVPGTSVYIGRPRDIGIDEACTWYQLPNMASVIATAAGLWVSPVSTSTYMVRQEICGNVKWDTMVVKEEPLGIEESSMFKVQSLKVYPVPAKDLLNLQLDNVTGSTGVVKVFNHLGMLVREEELVFKEGKAVLKTNDLSDGVYYLELYVGSSGTARTRFVVGR